jgi:putative hydrolase of the HAD superfamily
LRDISFVYFDLDDTLCGYWDASKAGLRSTFAELGPEGKTPEEMVEHWGAAYREFAPLVKSPEWYPQYLVSGRPTRVEHMRRVLLRIGIEDEPLAQALAERYAQARNEHLRLFSDAIEVLETLAGKVGLGLITNGPADIQRQEIATLGVGGYFQHVFIEGEVGEGKPLASVFDRARVACDCTPNTILMVGNSYGHDIRGAIQAGWKTAWIRRPSDVPPSAAPNAGPEVKPANAPEPSVTIGALSELLPILGFECHQINQ